MSETKTKKLKKCFLKKFEFKRNMNKLFGAATSVKEINDHAVALATTMASKILRREVGAGDQSRLVSESLAELSRARN